MTPPRAGIALLALSLAGCLATQHDLQAVAAQQAELGLELVRMQDHLADLTLRVQALHADVRDVRGNLTMVEQQGRPLADEVDRLRQRLADLEVRAEMRAQFAAQAGPAAAPATSASGATAATAPNERLQWADATQAYAAAVSNVREGKNALATQQLLALLRRWPTDAHAVPAQVQLGETYLRSARGLDAVEQFLDVIERHPQHAWTPRAYLGLADALAAIAQREQALRVLDDLVRLFPQSAEAAAAGERRRAWDTAAAAATAPAAPAAGGRAPLR